MGTSSFLVEDVGFFPTRVSSGLFCCVCRCLVCLCLLFFFFFFFGGAENKAKLTLRGPENGAVRVQGKTLGLATDGHGPCREY